MHLYCHEWVTNYQSKICVGLINMFGFKGHFEVVYQNDHNTKGASSLIV